MEALSHNCCEKCNHSVQTPCDKYVRCRTEGPLCHDDENCRNERARLLSKMTNPAGISMRQILICTGTGCASSGSNRLIDLIREELVNQGIDETVHVRSTGCHGFCEQGPILIIEPDKTFYTKVKPSDIKEIVARDILGGEKVDRLLFKDPLSGETAPTYESVNFYAKQNRIVLSKCGLINPERVSQYFAHKGYIALEKALQKMQPEEVIEEIKKSALRGRGGAGFPTGLKWSFCRATEGNKKYIICNADEGDPGAFMDRSVLEGDPHAVIEGMLIGAYAIGADEGYIYCRAEYPLAIERLKIAIDQAEKYGLLGNNILNSGFNFKLKIKEGAGAFVCGEETALIASIEGQRGMPRVRPPYPAVKGLWGKPTNINNVETWANVPHIILNGADWYTQFGTEKSKGTKIFAMTGKVNNTGLVEVSHGNLLCAKLSLILAAGSRAAKNSKLLRLGDRLADVCLKECWISLLILTV